MTLDRRRSTAVLVESSRAWSGKRTRSDDRTLCDSTAVHRGPRREQRSLVRGANPLRRQDTL